MLKGRGLHRGVDTREQGPLGALSEPAYLSSANLVCSFTAVCLSVCFPLVLAQAVCLENSSISSSGISTVKYVQAIFGIPQHFINTFVSSIAVHVFDSPFKLGVRCVQGLCHLPPLYSVPLWQCPA